MATPSLTRLPMAPVRPAAPGPSRRTPLHVPGPADPREARRLERLIANRVGRAIQDWSMIGDGDRVLVAVSGGKDSATLLHVLDGMRRRAPIRFELVAVNIDQGWTGYRQDAIGAWLESRGFPHRLVRENIAGIVRGVLDQGEALCSLCSRLRRGVLYRVAGELGATRIALGHHADDLMETLLLNQLFAGEIRTMAPRLVSDDGRHVVIRPLAYVPEDLIAAFARASGFPLVCCMCDSCGDESLKRKQIKALLTTLEGNHPGIKKSLFRSLSRIDAAHMLDRRWIDGGITG